MESADQILAVLGIDAGLPADRRIDLGQQRGRHLDIIDAATDRGGGEAGKIADDAAAECDHQVGALDAANDERFTELLVGAEALGVLSRGQNHAARHDAGRLDRRLGGREVIARDRLIGDDGELGAGPERGDTLAERAEHVASDHDVIGCAARGPPSR